MFNRVIIKLSGEALAKNCDSFFDDTVIDRICKEIAEVQIKGTEVALVVGGGNIWRGVDSKRGLDRTKSDQIGMLGTVMNAIYLADYFKQNLNVKAVVMTPITIGTITVPFSKEAALDYMSKGYIVINAAGVGHPYFSTDTITALRGAELDVDCILYAKSIDGIYEADPKKVPTAKRYKTITYDTIIKNSLSCADISAINISLEADIPSMVFALEAHGSLVTACKNTEESYKICTKAQKSIEEDFYE